MKVLFCNTETRAAYFYALPRVRSPRSMREAHVVSTFSVQKLSLTEKGIPSSGPRGSPDVQDVVLTIIQTGHLYCFKDLLSSVTLIRLKQNHNRVLFFISFMFLTGCPVIHVQVKE